MAKIENEITTNYGKSLAAIEIAADRAAKSGPLDGKFWNEITPEANPWSRAALVGQVNLRATALAALRSRLTNPRPDEPALQKMDELLSPSGKPAIYKFASYQNESLDSKKCHGTCQPYASPSTLAMIAAIPELAAKFPQLSAKAPLGKLDTKVFNRQTPFYAKSGNGPLELSIPDWQPLVMTVMAQPYDVTVALHPGERNPHSITRVIPADQFEPTEFKSGTSPDDIAEFTALHSDAPVSTVSGAGDRPTAPASR